MTLRLTSDGVGLPPALKILSDAIFLLGDGLGSARSIKPFVTISRQPGTGTDTLPARLALRLNSDGDGGSGWSVWDHQLVERTTLDSEIAGRIVEMIDEQPEAWLQELSDGYVIGQERCNAKEFCTYKRVTVAIRSLAAAGNAIIVGRGGMFVTLGMPNGIRIRIIAPMEHRIRCMAEEFGLSRREAGERVAMADHERDVFFHRYWPGKVLTPEAFSMTFNSAETSVDEMVESIVPMIRARGVSRQNQAFLRLA